MLDELGYVPASKVGAELLFDVISTSTAEPIELGLELLNGAGTGLSQGSS